MNTSLTYIDPSVFVLQDKCEHYWPDTANEPKQYGDIVVNLISVSNMDKFDINIFQVSQVRIQQYSLVWNQLFFTPKVMFLQVGYFHRSEFLVQPKDCFEFDVQL